MDGNGGNNNVENPNVGTPNAESNNTSQDPTRGFDPENQKEKKSLGERLSPFKDGLDAYRQSGSIGGMAKNLAKNKLNDKINEKIDDKKQQLKDNVKNKVNDKLPESVKKKKEALDNKKQQMQDKINAPKKKLDEGKAKLNEKAFKGAVKTAVDAAAPGAGTAAEKLLDTPKGAPALDAAREASNPASAIAQGTKKLVQIVMSEQVKKTLIMKLLPVIIAVIAILIIPLTLTKFFNSEVYFKGYAEGDSTGEIVDKDLESFYKNIEKYGGSNPRMVVAVLTAYQDNDVYGKDGDYESDCTDEEIEAGTCETSNNNVSSKSKRQMKKYIKKVAKQIDKSGDISEGDYEDPENTGSKFFQWLYKDFVEDYYSEYFKDIKSKKEIAEKKQEIISFIYAYYEELNDSNCITGSVGNYDSTCDYNLTQVDVLQCNTSNVMTTIGLKDYILGVVYGEIASQGDDENTFKTQAIAAKTYILVRKGYNSQTKRIKAQACTREQVWCDIYNGCNIYKDSGGFDSTYSKAYSPSLGGRTYKPPMSSERFNKWSKWYDEAYPYLFIDKSKHNGPITTFTSSDSLGYFDKEQNYWYDQSTKNHYTFDQLLKMTASAPLPNAHYYRGKDIYNLGEYCGVTSPSTISGNFYYYAQGVGPWANILHGCGSGSTVAAKGCFQTSTAIALSNLFKTEITPTVINTFTANNKANSCTGVTSYYTLFGSVAKAYNLYYKMYSNKTSSAPSQMLEELSKGNWVLQILGCTGHTADGVCSVNGGHAIAIGPSSKEGFVTILDPATPKRPTHEVEATKVTGTNTSAPLQASFYVLGLQSGSNPQGNSNTSSDYLVPAGGAAQACFNNGISATAMKYNKTIYVGDSRTVGMKAAVSASENETFIAEVGKGYNWFTKTATSQLETALKENQKVNVVINLGTNDLTDSKAYEKYIGVYKSLAEKYTETSFIITSVTPIDDKSNTSYPNVNNSMVVEFNKNLSGKFPNLSNLKYCNIYDKTVSGGYKSSDGLHYDNETYKKIYGYIKAC